MRHRMLLKANGIKTPTIQASNISFSNISYTSMTARWQRGNGQFCIVLCRERYSVSTNPLMDNVKYTANSIYNQGQTIAGAKVVYIGTGNLVSVTGLARGMLYYFKIYEFNSMGNLIKYLQVEKGSNSGSRSTLR